MKAIRYHNTSRIGRHIDHDWFVANERVDDMSIHHYSKLQKAEQELVFLQDNNVIFLCRLYFFNALMI